jgi:MFS family permease
MRLATGSMNALPIDLAPPAAVGSLTSIQTFFGNVGGLLAPIIGGRIVSVTGSFVLSLLAAGGMALFGAVSYLFIMGNLEKPEWTVAKRIESAWDTGVIGYKDHNIDEEHRW